MIPSVISHYQILEKLGEGGMGVVYKARDTKLNRIVALKFLPDRVNQSEEEKARFLQEAQAAAGLNHNNICTVFGVEEQDGHLYMAMEYIEGGTLREKLPFASVNDAIAVAEQIGDALQEAHEKGIVHRDIKSDNIMLTSRGQPKVMDFGLAKLKGSMKLTRSSSTLGTLAYMAPEQIQEGVADARSDIFSLGALLYEMLTGKTPFRGEHEAAMMYSILHQEPDSLQQSRADIPPVLDRIISRALQKDPADRYQSAADIAGELRRIRKTKTGVVQPSEAKGTPTTSVGPAARKGTMPTKRRVILSGAAGVALLAVALYFLVWRHSVIDSLAVLPFENVGADPNTEYLSDGITESLINTLSQLSSLTVMSRSSVFHYKGKDVDPRKAGNELGVRAVLVGRVMQRGDNLQISTELVDVSNNSHIWGARYDKKMSDILAVQEEISREISRQLSLKLIGEDEKKLARRSTENIEAYQRYLKGRFHWNRRNESDLWKAVDYFNQAIEKDSEYALAYAGLASTFVILPIYSGLPARDYIPKIEAAAKRAMSLDETLGEPHVALGFSRYSFQWDWDGAEKELKRAIELNPSDPTNHQWYGGYLEQRGKLKDALDEFKRAQELDPLSPIITDNLGEVFFYMEQFDQAIEQYNKTLELDSAFTLAYLDLGELYARQQKFDLAISKLIQVRQISGANSPYGLGDLGYICARAGKNDEAMKSLNQLVGFSEKGFTQSVQIAVVYGALGNKDRAFEWLERGYQERNWQLGYLGVDPYWEGIRSDPRFTALLKKIGLE
jgi:serine/threonine-protein kinase